MEELEKRLKAVSTENDRLKRLLAEKELELAIFRELRDRVNPRSMADKVAMAEKWIPQGYNVRLVLGFVGLPLSTYYAFRTRRTQEKFEPQEGDISTKEPRRSGRPRSTYSLSREAGKYPTKRLKNIRDPPICRTRS
ncbi:hypothetical protein V3F56_07315 [Moorellaceae bacterium AZ2]